MYSALAGLLQVKKNLPTGFGTLEVAPIGTSSWEVEPSSVLGFRLLLSRYGFRLLLSRYGFILTHVNDKGGIN